MKIKSVFFGLSALLLFVRGAPLIAQIPASELPLPGADTGLDGKNAAWPKSQEGDS